MLATVGQIVDDPLQLPEGAIPGLTSATYTSLTVAR